jgi:hypothetical protein
MISVQILNVQYTCSSLRQFIHHISDMCSLCRHHSQYSMKVKTLHGLRREIGEQKQSLPTLQHMHGIGHLCCLHQLHHLFLGVSSFMLTRRLVIHG